MNNIIKISFRNLLRNRRRTLLTASLITIGVMFVLIYSALAGSFKAYMIGQVTDSMLGHIQIHKQGYIASVDNLPLDKNLNAEEVENIKQTLENNPFVESYTFRLKLGSMFSNYIASTSVRLNGIDPIKEAKTLPLFAQRIAGSDVSSLEQGTIIVPELLAKGMNVKKDDTIVLVATNLKGSVNGLNFKVAGTIEPISGPGGRDGYIHIKDVTKLLRLNQAEVSEVVIRLKDVDKLEQAMKSFKSLRELKNKKGKPLLELHTWKALSPFYNIVKMLDLMDISIKIILISIVLISVLNVMVMSVYERIKEIGTIAAMGTSPATITKLFLSEGLMLGVLGSILGSLFSYAIVFFVNTVGISFSFGRQDNLVLNPVLHLNEMLIISAIVVLISLIASISPAIKAANLNPVDALRQN